MCESSAPQIDFFDSNYNLELDTMIYLSGRKYLCQVCFHQAAEYFGYESSDDIRHAEEVKEEMKARVKALYNHLENARNEAMAKWNQVEATPVKRPPGRPRKHPVPDAT